MRAERPAADPARASARRREKGRAPEPAGPKDTRTSMQQQPQERGGTGGRKRPGTVADDDNRVSVEGGVSGALACVKGPEAGLTLALAPGSYTIGRARENDLVLKDIAASRKHLRIDVDQHGARLVDLGSGNGSRVNGKRASECELRHGDSIEIGASVIIYSEPGRVATVDKGPARDEAQARVVAAADELAKELSQKLRFGDDDGAAEFDGHKAQTRAIRTADARAAAAAIAEEAAASAQKKPGDRLWNETFTNMPLSAVVAEDQRLQGTRDLPKKAPPQRPMTPAPITPPARQMGPMGTAASNDVVYDEPLVEEFSQAPRGSFVTSVLLSAGVVVVVGALALGLWALLFREQPAPQPTTADAAVQAEKDAEYAKAISRAQDAITRQDWVAVRDYTVVALQSRPKDPLALAYKGDAEQRIEAALKAASEPTPPPPEPAPPPPPEPAAAPPTPAPAPAPHVAPPPPPPRPAPPRPKPRPKPTSKRTISDDEAKARFERAIDAFRSKDNATGCKLLEQVADRASADSSWRGKADSLYLKRCGG